MSDEPLEALPTAVLAQMVRDLQVRRATLEAELALLRGGGPPAPPRKTPTNSSVPPAKGFKARRPAPLAGSERPKRGAKAGHAGVSRQRVDRNQIDLVLPCRPHDCASCGTLLPDHGGAVVGRRQVPPACRGRCAQW